MSPTHSYRSFVAWLLTACVVVSTSISACVAAAEPDKPSDEKSAAPKAESAGRQELWIGIYGVPADEVLRSQLNLDGGLVLERVVPNSPAEKAGLKRFDIITKFGDAKVTNLADIAGVLERHGEQEVPVSILRGGQVMELKVTPAQRPAAIGFDFNFGPSGDRDRVLRWLDQMREGRDNEGLRMWLLRPGVVVPNGEFEFTLPGDWLEGFGMPRDSSITITKHGTDPAKVVVRIEDKKWEVTEDNLKDLPNNVRPFVEMWLRGRGINPMLQGTAPFRLDLNDTFNQIEKLRSRQNDSVDNLRREVERMKQELEQLRKEIRPETQKD